ncbi:MAG: hypothetical protein CL424_14580 [Acidimicrobiaceae bacterium]|nr:hypothetical protein [Acidimicrobiaceae bacterium]
MTATAPPAFFEHLVRCLESRELLDPGPELLAAECNIFGRIKSVAELTAGDVEAVAISAACRLVNAGEFVVEQIGGASDASA